MLAPTQEMLAPTLATAFDSLPPEGALRLRPGKAGSAALTCGAKALALVASPFFAGPLSSVRSGAVTT